MTSFDRRRFLALGAGAVSGLWLAGCSGSGSGAGPTSSADGAPSSAGGATVPPSTAQGEPTAAPKKQPSGKAARRLVVVELDGGNDGMSTLVPHGMTGYKDLRSRTLIADEDLVEFGGDKAVALHKNLKGLKDKGLAVVQGVGTAQPDGSHFEMMERWWRGDVSGTAGLTTGFLGRLCDQLADPSARVTGLSFGSGNHPAMQAAKASTLSIPGAGAAGYLAGANVDDKRARAFQDAFAQMAAAARPDAVGQARRSMRDAVGVAQMLAGLNQEEKEREYPGSNLGQSLKLTARLLAADPLVRVVHLPMGVDFDTHQDHPGRHAGNMAELNDALVAFLADLDARGLGDQVLVATTSEFGRTARDNGSNGLDHGTASVALLAGPVNAGLYGQHPSLTDLDEDDQLVATVGFDQYYATLAERWFGIPAGEVLPGKPTPLDGIV